MVTLNPEQRRQYEARNRRLLAAARAGVTYREIGERFGLSEARACRIATRAGIYRIKPWKDKCDTNPR